MSILNLIGLLIPANYREQCLGDIYEGYYILRQKKSSRIVTMIITIWKVLCLIWGAFTMRLEDLFSSDNQENSAKFVQSFERYLVARIMIALLLSSLASKCSEINIAESEYEENVETIDLGQLQRY